MRHNATYLPVIIVGAGRSGTNMLRDILTQLSGVVTWPCDEINYIWRHGNVTAPTDEFGAEMVTPDIRKYVRGSFDRLADEHVTHVVEKTCANSLRVDFVDRILPDACYIHLVRDGRDVALSAASRWTAPLDLPYILRKARFVPKCDLPFYAGRYLWSRVYRRFTKAKRLSSWGPRFEGMAAAHAKHGLLEVCALQWQRCVERSDQSFERIHPSRVCQLRYEEFVHQPAVHLRGIGSFLGIEISATQSEQLTDDVSPKSTGSARSHLSTDEWESITNLISPTLARHGYATRSESSRARAA